jgi:hypothetical protein
MAGARRPGRRPDAEDAIVAAGHLDPLEGDGPDDLRKGERQHREIDAAQPHAEPAEHQCAQAAKEWPGEQRRFHRQPQMLRRQCGAVGAQPEIGGVAEGGEAADRHQDMKRHGEDYEDEDF